MKIGLGKSVIQINDEILPLESFITIHDDIHIRVLWLSKNIEFIIVSLEMTSLREYEIEHLKEIITKYTNVTQEHIMISVTHSFSTPHTRSLEAMKKMTLNEFERYQQYLKNIDIALVDALNQAQTKHEATMGFQNSVCSINVSRDMKTAEGWGIGADDLGISDKSVGIIRFDDCNHQPLCILYSYDIQSSIMDKAKIDGGYEITSDLVGKCSEYIEDYLGVCAIYVLSSSGDQSPIFKANHNLIGKDGQIINEDIGKEGYTLVNALGKKLAHSIIAGSEKISTKPVHKIKYYCYLNTYQGQKICTNIKPTKTYEYIKDSSREEQLSILIIGEIAIVALRPELSSFTGMTIKNKSPFFNTMVWTMINGASKYMPDQLAYDRITYEAMNSLFYRNSAEELANHAIEYLKQIREDINDENRT